MRETAEGDDFGSLRDIPEFDRPVIAGGRQDAPVGRERDRSDWAGMARQRSQLAATRRVDKFDFLVKQAEREYEKAIEMAGKPGPRVRISRRLATSQNLTVLSADPDASVFPSGVKAREKTPCE
jgi:hypothetical protein